MRIVNGVEVLELSMHMMGTLNVIHPVLIWDDDSTILVDAGYPGQIGAIKEAVGKAGISFDNLNKVIITHQDIDHIGSLLSIKNEFEDRVEILAHKDEIPFIKGDKCPIKVAQLEDKLEVLPEKAKAMYQMLKTTFEKLRVNVDKELLDGQVLPYCGGITVICTPGHTPGHICLYLNKSKVLIAGDALNIIKGQLTGPNPQHAFNALEAVMSLEKLKKYDIETVVCYHGGIYKDNVNQRIAELVNG